MDPISIILILIALLAVGGVAVFAAVQTGLWSSWALPAPSAGRVRAANDRALGAAGALDQPDDDAADNGRGDLPAGSDLALRVVDIDVARIAPGGERRGEAWDAIAVSHERLLSIQSGVGELGDVVARRLDDLAREATRDRERLEQATAEAEGRLDVAFARLRRDMSADRQQGWADGWLGERRAEMAADLYQRLARLEAAIAAVTNPILLPGEPYAPPAELMAEALTWDNWKDVGERAFSFADTYSSRRIYLSEEASQAVAAFVTRLRGLLTRSIYPNLRLDPTPAQSQALRTALDEVAAELPRLRAILEREFRAATARPASIEDA